MSVRCKVQCINKSLVGQVFFGAAQYGSEENAKFFSMTPSIGIQMGVVNDEAYAQFEVGKEYYLDFTPAE